MALFYANGIADALLSTAKRVDARKFDAVTRSILVNFTLPTGLANDDIIRLARLPAGAVVLPKPSFVNVLTNPGTLLELNIGIEGAEDIYADGIVCSAVGHVAFGTGGVQHGNLLALQNESWIVAEVEGSTALIAGAMLQFFIEYRSQSGG